MQFNDESGGSGILQDISFITGADKSITDADLFVDYTLKDRTRNVNRWNDKVLSWIFEVDGRMQYDDPNHTNSPTATINLNNGQSKYELFSATPLANQDWLRLRRVEILNESGNYVKLKPFDEMDLKTSWNEFEENDGTPAYYNVNGTIMELKPAPNYDKNSGLMAFFQRNGTYFTTTDTTKIPGFATPYHRILSLGASLDWLIPHRPGEYNAIKTELLEYKADLQNFYTWRHPDDKKRIVPNIENYE